MKATNCKLYAKGFITIYISGNFNVTDYSITGDLEDFHVYDANDVLIDAWWSEDEKHCLDDLFSKYDIKMVTCEKDPHNI